MRWSALVADVVTVGDGLDIHSKQLLWLNDATVLFENTQAQSAVQKNVFMGIICTKKRIWYVKFHL